jgi:CubicO group peptidase (beta-lactamase class C family)
MRKQTDATEDTAPGIIPAAPWRVASVQALTGYCLRVRFVDGTEGTVDLSRLITGKDAGVFATLRDPELFGQASLDYGAVVWPGELDLAPDAMYDAIKAHGRWVLD